MSERNETFECFAEEPKVYESEEEHFNDIFAGYEADHQKALALIVWQEEQIKNLETAIRVYRSCLEHNNKKVGWCKQSEWISVEERFPDKNTFVLVWCGNVAVCQYLTKNIWFTGAGYVSGEITHWMPLPEAPKGGEE